MEAGHVSGPAPFLLKTYEMVDDSCTDDVVSWSETGASFVVWNPPEFAARLLPSFFKHNNFSSFIRQLNTYGFRKSDPERWEFCNEHFLKGQKHLLKSIHRRKPVHSHSAPAGGPSLDRAQLEDEIERLSRERAALQAELWRFKQQQSGARAQTQEIQQRILNMEQRQLKMLSFLHKASSNPKFMQSLAELADGLTGQIRPVTQAAAPVLLADSSVKKRRLPGTETEYSLESEKSGNQNPGFYLESEKSGNQNPGFYLESEKSGSQNPGFYSPEILEREKSGNRNPGFYLESEKSGNQSPGFCEKSGNQNPRFGEKSGNQNPGFYLETEKTGNDNPIVGEKSGNQNPGFCEKSGNPNPGFGEKSGNQNPGFYEEHCSSSSAGFEQGFCDKLRLELMSTTTNLDLTLASCANNDMEIETNNDINGGNDNVHSGDFDATNEMNGNGNGNESGNGNGNSGNESEKEENVGPQARVNDVFWEQFLTEKPGCENEEASSNPNPNPNPSEKEEGKDMERLKL